MNYSVKESAPVGEKVRIPCVGAILAGELAIPAGAGGLVLFAHGSGSSRHSPRNQYVAKLIRKLGTGTLLFDLLTREEESLDLCTGELRFDVEFLATRLMDATRWLAGRPEAQNLGIGYFGSSTGGAAALVAAAELGKRISAVVSRGGRPDLAGYSLSRVEAPTLLIVGGQDEGVIELNQQAFAKLRGVKELKIIPGATHLFEEPGALDAVARAAGKWFHRYLPHDSEDAE